MSKHARKQGPFVQLGAFALTVLLTISITSGSQASGPTSSVNLGTAANFAVLAHTGITNTGNTTIAGPGSDMGSYPNAAFTGHETVTVPSGATKYLIADSVTETAKADLAIAYAEVEARNDGTLISSGPQTLPPGLYKTTATFALAANEILTLDAGENTNAVFVFQIGTDLSLAAGSQIALINGAQAKNVVWQVGTSASFAANASFAGSVMANVGITAAAGAIFQGQLLAMTTAVTLIGNTITNNSFAAPAGPAAVAPTATSTFMPSGAALIGSVLTNAVAFSGTPSPTVTYSWQFSSNGTSGWTSIAGATGSSFTLTGSQVGGYVRTVVTATNTAGAVTQNSPATDRVLPPAPARPVLASASDTGSNSSDGVTSVTRPSLSLTGLVVGAEVIVTATKGSLQETCSFTATSSIGSCVFPNQLADGSWTLRSNNVLSSVSSAGSSSLLIVIDTTAPAIATFTANQDSLGASLLTHSLVFGESVTGLVAGDFTLVSATVTCGAPTLSGSGLSYTVSLANCQGDGPIQLRLRSGAAQDLAGNNGPTSAFLTTKAIRPDTTPTTPPPTAPPTAPPTTPPTAPPTTPPTAPPTMPPTTPPTTPPASVTPTPTPTATTTPTPTPVTEESGASPETNESEPETGEAAMPVETETSGPEQEDTAEPGATTSPTPTDSASQEAEIDEGLGAQEMNGSGDQGSGVYGCNWWPIIGLVIGVLLLSAVIFLMRRRLV